jgi:thioesterase domain-containing protein
MATMEESLREYLNEKIPITRAMGVTVLEATADRVELEAPLPPNVNHSGTVFGGSAASVAVLSAWSLLHLLLRREGIAANIVVHKCSMTYERPIVDTFASTSETVGPAEWGDFLDALKRRMRAKMRLRSVLRCNGEKVGEMVGDFVALGQSPPARP